jgi:hypothetical protein
MSAASEVTQSVTWNVEFQQFCVISLSNDFAVLVFFDALSGF